MLKTKKNTIIAILLIALATVLLGAFANLSSNATNTVSAHAAENYEQPTENPLFHGYNIDNIEPFLEYLTDLGYDVEDDDFILSLLSDKVNFEVLYYHLLNEGIINFFENDYLREFLPPSIFTPFWAGGKQYDQPSCLLILDSPKRR